MNFILICSTNSSSQNVEIKSSFYLRVIQPWQPTTATTVHFSPCFFCVSLIMKGLCSLFATVGLERWRKGRKLWRENNAFREENLESCKLFRWWNEFSRPSSVHPALCRLVCQNSSNVEQQQGCSCQHNGIQENTNWRVSAWGKKFEKWENRNERQSWWQFFNPNWNEWTHSSLLTMTEIELKQKGSVHLSSKCENRISASATCAVSEWGQIF